MEAWKFDFGPASPDDGKEGAVRVTERTAYADGLGYGFTGDGVVTAKDRGEGERPLRDFCIPYGATFRVDVPNGNYVVTLTMGDPCAPVEGAVRANHKPLLPALSIPAGLSRTERFAAHVSDGSLRLSFGGAAPRLNALEVAAAPHALTLFLAGDSTVTDESEDNFPYAGWGMLLPSLFKHDVAVANYASSGRSSKSFIDEGRLDRIAGQLKRDDYLFIQFGHNDQKPDAARRTEPADSYPAYLRRYIDAARAKGAHPVLVTSVHRRFFAEDGTLRDTHGAYLEAMRELAAVEGVPLVDLAARSRELFERLGPEGTKDVFMWSAPGEYAKFPEGAKDNTHFQERGAARIAGLVAEEIRRLPLWPLAMYLR